MLDPLLGFLWIGCVLYGAGSGLIRQLFLLGAVYGGLIVALQGSELMAQGAAATGGPRGMSYVYPVSFLLCLVATVVLVTLLSYYSYPTTWLATRRWLDHLGGTLLAALWGMVLVAGLLIALQYFTVPGVWPKAQEELRLTVELSLQDSQLKPLLFERVPLLRQAVSPWIPEALRERRGGS
ncbi:MAG: CvpA family protein [Chloroflexi bacterium]|nr:CvpA family protein [Chloroflexota bacterium]